MACVHGNDPTCWPCRVATRDGLSAKEQAVIEAAQHPRLRLQFKRPSGVPGPFPEVEAAFWEAVEALKAQEEK